jgi:hypothetical protein
VCAKLIHEVPMLQCSIGYVMSFVGLFCGGGSFLHGKARSWSPETRFNDVMHGV